MIVKAAILDTIIKNFPRIKKQVDSGEGIAQW